jgi:hypothetical protein
MTTPTPMMLRMVHPNHFGLGLGFFFGGAWYRRRLDFDLGIGERW